MKVLVTGGLGFVGSILSHSLVRKGHKVHIIDDGSHALVQNVSGATVDRYQVDRNALDWIEGLDVVIHLGAMSTVSECESDPMLAVRKNCLDFSGFLSALVAKYKKIPFVVNASSCAVYHSESYGIMEEWPVAPTSVYGMTKCIVEGHLRGCSKWLKSVSLRFSNIVGAAYGIVEGARGEDRLIPSLFRALDKKTSFRKNGECVRDYLHVMDAVDAILKVVSAMKCGKVSGRGEPYNICSESAYTISQVVLKVEQIAGRNIRIEEARGRQGDVLKTAPSNRLARKMFGWKPKRTLEEAVKDAWRTHVKHSPRP